MNPLVLRRIAERFGATHVGYYTMLHLYGLHDARAMSNLCKLRYSLCVRIEQDLIDIGALMSLKGGGIAFPHLEAEKLVAYFADKSGRTIVAGDRWYEEQLKIASALLENYSYDQCVFMLDYLLDVQKKRVFSLKFLQYVAAELMPLYQRQQAIKDKVSQQSYWQVEPTEKPQIIDEVTSSDVAGILSFNIELTP